MIYHIWLIKKRILLVDERSMGWDEWDEMKDEGKI